MSDKELLEPPGMSSAELKSLVDEFVNKGGVVKKYDEGVALNFRVGILEPEEEPQKIRVFKKKMAKRGAKKSKK